MPTKLPKDFKPEICVDCGRGVYKWFTTFLDKNPRCSKCAVRKFETSTSWGLDIMTELYRGIIDANQNS